MPKIEPKSPRVNEISVLRNYFWEGIAALLAICICLPPLSIARRNHLDYSSRSLFFLCAVHLLFAAWTVMTMRRTPIDTATAWKEVERVEEGCKAVLVVISIFFGLMRFFDTPRLALPSGGLDMLLTASALLVVGFIPYGPRLAGDNNAPDRAARQARVQRALKSHLLSGSLLSLALAVTNLQRFNPPIQ